MSDSKSHDAVFEVEAKVLRNALRGIQDEIKATQVASVSAGNRHAEKVISDMRTVRLRALEAMTDDPYFGRLDLVLADAEGDQTYYIGKHDAEPRGVRIIDWRTPVGGLFYKGGDRKQVYDRPTGGRSSAELLLKRQIVVKNGALNRVVDLVDNRDHTTATNAEEQFLVGQLETRGELRLQDIVRTIQSEQNDLIRAAHDSTMIIQGVAGSGKTSVAYYRLAYLLYPGNETGITASRTLIIGPSPLFLSYTAELLPDLGERDVAQTTLEQLALAQVYAERGSARGRRARFRRLAGEHQFAVLDSTLEVLASGRLSEEREAALVAASHVRGSTRMRELVRRYAQSLRDDLAKALPAGLEEVASPASAIGQVVSRQGRELDRSQREFLEEAATVALEPERVMASLTTSARAPLGHLRIEVFKELAWVPADGPRNTHTGELATLFDEFQIRDIEERARLTQRFEAIVEAYVDSLVGEFDAATLFYRLLSQLPLVKELGGDAFTPDEVSALVARRTPGRDTVHADDIGAILALHFELHGSWIADWGAYQHMRKDAPPPEPLEKRLAHIVVDEGQDLSPLEYALISEIAGRGSMTILGDTSQGVFDYRGITTWDEVIEALPDRQIVFEEMHRSYRSTAEIVGFCNELLRKGTAYTGTLATPVDRHGRTPRIEVTADAETLLQRLEDRISELRDADYTTIAVVCRSPKQRRKMASELIRVLGSDAAHELDSTSTSFGGGVSVVTAGDAKGLEFEVALVVDADPQMYPANSAFARKSLYVACTRALHVLDVYAVGEATPLLARSAETAELIGACDTHDDSGLRCLKVAGATGCCEIHEGTSSGRADKLVTTPFGGGKMTEEQRIDTDVRGFIQAGLQEAAAWKTAADVDMGTRKMPCTNWRAIVAFVAVAGSFDEAPLATKYLNRAANDQVDSILSYLGRNSMNPGVVDEAKRLYKSRHNIQMSDPMGEVGWWH